MSYEKLAAVTTPGSEQPAKIRYYYETDSIFNKLNLRTHYRAKMVKDGKGEVQLDDIAISQDERDMVNEMLEQAIYELGTYMFKIAQGVSNSIFFNTTLSDVLAKESSGFEMIDNAAYNENLLPVIDKKIETCLIFYCLREWYGSVAMPDDIKSNTFLYKEHLDKLNQLTFQMRKKTMS